mmetsp:Transcript_27794/g.47255  ORF Transcript_27794/g.47255 Transcript_27794/m.47255 type:complete len:271 (+) Transcript_27794:136-948(+)
MVEISEVMEEDPQPTQPSSTNNAAESRSQERLDDADEIECALSHITRPSARLHMENLITKLRKEGKALQRVAASASKSSSASGSAAEDEDAAAESMDVDADKTPPPAAAAPVPQAIPDIPKRTPAKLAPAVGSKYQSFPTYYFDSGKYDSPTVSVYVPLEGIGQHDKSKISCNFTSGSFDLIVTDYQGKSYRLLNDNLEKDIEVSKSKYLVKPNKIIIKLGKVKGEYGFDSWSQLTAKKNEEAQCLGESRERESRGGHYGHDEGHVRGGR